MCITSRVFGDHSFLSKGMNTDKSAFGLASMLAKLFCIIHIPDLSVSMRVSEVCMLSQLLLKSGAFMRPLWEGTPTPCCNVNVLCIPLCAFTVHYLGSQLSLCFWHKNYTPKFVLAYEWSSEVYWTKSSVLMSLKFKPQCVKGINNTAIAPPNCLTWALKLHSLGDRLYN